MSGRGVLLLSVPFLLLWCVACLQCTRATSPYLEGNNVKVYISSPDSLHDRAKAFVCTLAVFLPDLVDSVVVEFGEGEKDTTLVLGKQGDEWFRCTLQYAFVSDGLKEVRAKGYAEENVTQATLSVQVVRTPAIGNEGALTVSGTPYPGSTLLLVGSVVGTPPITYHWQKNGSTIDTSGTDTLSFSAVKLADEGVYRLIAANLFGADTSKPFTLRVLVATDSAPPVLRLADPSLDSLHVSSDTRRVDVIALDEGQIDSVKFVLGARVFSAIAESDSLYYANLSGLTANTYNAIAIVATDAGGNTCSLVVHLYYDPTLPDNSPPIILQESGPQNGDRVKEAGGTVSFSVTDENGVDSVWYTLDGTLQATLQPLATNYYDVDYVLGTYGKHTLAITARDGSTAQNEASMVIHLDHNTPISAFSSLWPADGAMEMSAFTFSWTGADDPDGDAVHYRLFYGTSATALTGSIDTAGAKSVPAPALSDNTQYYWRVKAYSDTYPEDSTASAMHGFRSVNRPPAVSLVSPVGLSTPADIATSSFQYGGTDPDGSDTDLRYVVIVGEDSASLLTVGAKSSELAQTTYALSNLGLLPGKKYYWCVEAIDEAGQAFSKRDTSEVTSFHTGNAAPIWNTSGSYSNWENERMAIDLANLVTYVEGPGHALSISLSGAGAAWLRNDTLFWKRPAGNTADTTVTVTATDSWSPDPRSANGVLTVGLKPKPAGTEGMRFIPAENDSFRMGSSTGEADEKPVHTVHFTYSVWMDTTEVDMREYIDLMSEYHPAMILPVWSHDSAYMYQYPADSLSWYHAMLYCNSLSKKYGLDTVYCFTSIQVNDWSILDGVTSRSDRRGYRLPTEAEWEYACRAGTSTDYYWGSASASQYEWYAGSISPFSTLQKVATKLPNGFGLYDMCGNVAEWCHDPYDNSQYSYPAGPQTDPMGPDADENTVVALCRGGHWNSVVADIRSAKRRSEMVYNRDNRIGFRTVLRAQ